MHAHAPPPRAPGGVRRAEDLVHVHVPLECHHLACRHRACGCAHSGAALLACFRGAVSEITLWAECGGLHAPALASLRSTVSVPTCRASSPARAHSGKGEGRAKRSMLRASRRRRHPPPAQARAHARPDDQIRCAAAHAAAGRRARTCAHARSHPRRSSGASAERRLAHASRDELLLLLAHVEARRPGDGLHQRVEVAPEQQGPRHHLLRRSSGRLCGACGRHGHGALLLQLRRRSATACRAGVLGVVASGERWCGRQAARPAARHVAARKQRSGSGGELVAHCACSAAVLLQYCLGTAVEVCACRHAEGARSGAALAASLNLQRSRSFNKHTPDTQPFIAWCACSGSTRRRPKGGSAKGVPCVWARGCGGVQSLQSEPSVRSHVAARVA